MIPYKVSLSCKVKINLRQRKMFCDLCFNHAFLITDYNLLAGNDRKWVDHYSYRNMRKQSPMLNLQNPDGQELIV